MEKKTPKRTKRLELRLTDEEIETIKKMKGSRGTLAKYARDRLLFTEEIVKVQNSVSNYLELVKQIKNIGHNVNQIAHKLNIGEDYSKVQAVKELKEELNRLRAIADETIEKVIK